MKIATSVGVHVGEVGYRGPAPSGCLARHAVSMDAAGRPAIPGAYLGDHGRRCRRKAAGGQGPTRGAGPDVDVLAVLAGSGYPADPGHSDSTIRDCTRTSYTARAPSRGRVSTSGFIQHESRRWALALLSCSASAARARAAAGVAIGVERVGVLSPPLYIQTLGPAHSAPSPAPRKNSGLETAHRQEDQPVRNAGEGCRRSSRAIRFFVGAGAHRHIQNAVMSSDGIGESHRLSGWVCHRRGR